MKKVLHRSFKPMKCKIALQMAASRLKIVKNKKDTQIKQLRRELAQLLESGQTQTAKIRVEHVVREEKTVAAYELVVSRLLVEKLSVKAPDGPTKIKILTEIATQHNVTWEAESLVESDPKETVLTSGASSCHSQSAPLGFVLLAMDLFPGDQLWPAAEETSRKEKAETTGSGAATEDPVTGRGRLLHWERQSQSNRSPNPSGGLIGTNRVTKTSPMWETEPADDKNRRACGFAGFPI
ncbi:Vacuolar protein sorting-associated protein Ist1 [Arabidopsis suecica]|uniref:Vacuolar protein sorting-associated protein Ist1 n=1 Tax=Arabidopsis suecica TaxID=45249 RepID=A0A8T2CRI8_ARASU|nr:Vacuolar protein sorting-associated protein Ist1 [Arabidopsis suecica]